MVRGVMISTHHSYHAADPLECDYGVTLYSDNIPAEM